MKQPRMGYCKECKEWKNINEQGYCRDCLRELDAQTYGKVPTGNNEIKS